MAIHKVGGGLEIHDGKIGPILAFEDDGWGRDATGIPIPCGIVASSKLGSGREVGEESGFHGATSASAVHARCQDHPVS